MLKDVSDSDKNSRRRNILKVMSDVSDVIGSRDVIDNVKIRLPFGTFLYRLPKGKNPLSPSVAEIFREMTILKKSATVMSRPSP